LEGLRDRANVAEARAQRAEQEKDKAVKSAQESAQKGAKAEVERFITSYPGQIKPTYKFEKDKAPFRLSDIYHDASYTYIRCKPDEQPAVYEELDGKPAMVNFDRTGDDIIRVGHVLHSGKLVIGKKSTAFYSTEK
jgi:hypothetical protein